MDHVAKNAAMQFSQEDLALFGVIRLRLFRNSCPDEVVDSLHCGLEFIFHRQKQVAGRHATLLNKRCLIFFLFSSEVKVVLVHAYLELDGVHEAFDLAEDRLLLVET